MKANGLGTARVYPSRIPEGGAPQTQQEILSAVGTAIHDGVCLDLGYADGHRLIAPDNVFLSKPGNLLVHGRRRVEGELVERNYRVDRIQSAEIVGLSARTMLSGALGVALIEASINSESPLSSPPEG